MQKNKDLNPAKRITALLMAGIMLATSIPLMQKSVAAEPNASDGHWSPECYFDQKAKDEGATAWFMNDGTLALQFPKATGGEKSFKDQTKKEITAYLIEIYKLGKKKIDITKPEEEHYEIVFSTVINAAATQSTMAEDGVQMLYAGFSPEDLTDARDSNGAEVKITQDSPYRFNVRITAIDGGKWFSEPIDTIVSSVPYFEYDEQKYEPIDVRNQYSLLEIMCFEGDSDQGDPDGEKGLGARPDGLSFIGSNQAGEPAVEYSQTTVDGYYGLDGASTHSPRKMPPFKGIGAPNAQGVPSKGLGFRILKPVDKQVSFETCYSRQAFDIYGTEEIWYWFDCSNVCLQDVNFKLTSNEKKWRIFWKNKQMNVDILGDMVGDARFSTKALQDLMNEKNPTNEYKTKQDYYKALGKTIKIQRSDGGWQNIDIVNGEKITLDHFKGYVRIPMEFFCSEAERTTFIDTAKLKAYWKDYQPATVKNALRIDGLQDGQEVVVVPKYTSMDKAPLLQHVTARRGVNGNIDIFKKAFLIPAVDIRDHTYDKDHATHPRRLRVHNGQYAEDANNIVVDDHGVNKQGCYKAYEDIFTAGFSFESVSDDSINHNFYVDNIMAYKPQKDLDGDGILDDNSFTNDEFNGSTNPGKPVTEYYDQSRDRAKIVIDAISDLITNPNWTDYQEVKYIHNLVKAFHDAYVAQPDSPYKGENIFLDTPGTHEGTKTELTIGELTGMAKIANKMGYLDIWERYRKARNLCLEYKTISEDKGDLVLSANADKSDLVPNIIQILEELPPVAGLMNPSEYQKEQIARLYQAYTKLNLAQMEMIGKEEQKKCFDYFRLLGNVVTTSMDSYVVGKTVAENPYVPFCNFDNQIPNTKIPQLEEDAMAYKEDASDFRHTKGVVVYNTDYDKFTTYNFGIQRIEGYLHLNKVSASMENVGFRGSVAPKIHFNTKPSVTMEKNELAEADVAAITFSKDATEHKNLDERRSKGKLNANLSVIDRKKVSNASDETTNPPISLMFYVDFTEFKGCTFGFTANIFSKWSVENTPGGTSGYVKFHVDMGQKDIDQKYFILDENGEWQLVHAGQRWYLPGANARPGEISLAGYKGYIRIPLYHFKGVSKKATDGFNKAIDAPDSELRDNIYSIQFGVFPDSKESAEQLTGKHYIIDNVGFTYGATAYKGVDPAKLGHDSYESQCNAMSSRARDFEKMIADVDPYADQNDFKTKVEEAYKFVDNDLTNEELTDYQKSLKSVQYAIKRLNNLRGWAQTPSTKPVAFNPWDSVYDSKTVEEMENEKMLPTCTALTKENFASFIKDVSKFPNKNPKNPSDFGMTKFPNQEESIFKVTMDSGVRFPGFKADTTKKQNESLDVDYEKFGFSAGEAGKRQVHQILLLFEYGFPRLSKADQNFLRFGTETPAEDALITSDFLAAKNVYMAAIRCFELEKTAKAVEKIMNGEQDTSLPEAERYNGLLSIYQPYKYVPEKGMSEIMGLDDPKMHFIEIKNRGKDINSNYPEAITQGNGKITGEFRKTYMNQPYYAKIASETGAVIPALKNVATSINLFLVNSRIFNAKTNLPEYTGLTQLQVDYTQLNNKLTTAIDVANSKYQLIDTTSTTEHPAGLWADVMNAIEDYDHLYPRFSKVGEIYTPIEHMRRKFPVVNTSNQGAAVTTIALAENETVKSAENTYAVTYAIDLSEIDSSKANALVYTKTAATTGKLAGKEYTLLFTFKQGSNTLGMATVKSADITSKDNIELFTLQPNTYDAAKPLTVDVKCTLAETPTEFVGKDEFTITVQNKTDAGLTTYQKAKNPDYASTIAPKKYELTYTKADTFTVSFPAETEIKWEETTAKDVGYTVTNNMRDGAKLTVSVEDSKAIGPSASATPHQLTCSVRGETYSIDYKPTGFTSSVITGTGASVTQNVAASIQIPTANWEKKASAPYQTHLTYTVEHTPVTTP